MKFIIRRLEFTSVPIIFGWPKPETWHVWAVLRQNGPAPSFFDGCFGRYPSFNDARAAVVAELARHAEV